MGSSNTQQQPLNVLYPRFYTAGSNGKTQYVNKVTFSIKVQILTIIGIHISNILALSLSHYKALINALFCMTIFYNYYAVNYEFSFNDLLITAYWQ